MPRSVSLRKHVLDVALFGGLVNRPGSFKRVLDVLLEEQVPEDELVLVDDLLANDETKRPLHIVLESQGFVDLEASGLLAEVLELGGVNDSALVLPLEGISTSDSGHKELLSDAHVLKTATNVLLERITPETGLLDSDLDVGVQLLLRHLFPRLLKQLFAPIN